MWPHTLYLYSSTPWKYKWRGAMINSGQYSGQSQLGSRLDAFCNMQNAYNLNANEKG